MRKIVLLLLVLTIYAKANSQYTFLGATASQVNCHSFIVTDAVNNQLGAVWNNTQINLNNSFDFNFDVNLGCTQNPGGADGMVFVLQNVGLNAQGIQGGQIGYGGINNNGGQSIGVEMDTWQNGSPCPTDNGDPATDHIAIMKNGDSHHCNALSPYVLVGSGGNLADCQYHALRVKWDALLKIIYIYYDGSLIITQPVDLINTIFLGNPMVWWGFTASTGGANNRHAFKTALNPSFHFPPNQKRCVNTPIQFIDSTISFAPLSKFYWDFGDLSPLDSVNLNPVHTYTVAGNYTIKQTVIGADGCQEVNQQLLTIGSKPIAGWRTTGDLCEANTIQFIDTSVATVGTINQWYWDIGNGNTSTNPNPTNSYTPYGNQQIKLWVKTAEGCESDTLFKPLYINAKPVADFSFTDSVCLGSPTFFTDMSTLADGPVTDWIWLFGDTASSSHTQNPVHIFLTPGLHHVVFTALNNANCAGGMSKDVFVVAKPTAYFKYGPVCQSAAVNLQDSSYSSDGIAITQWWWDLGNGNTSTSQNPLVTYNTAGPVTVKHVVYNARGCVSDTFTQVINVNAKPVAKFGVGKTLCDNAAVAFSDSSTVAGGTVSSWSWLFDNGTTSTQQNPAILFPAGNHWAKLVVKSNSGCESDTAFLPFTVSTKASLSFNFVDACKNSQVSFTASSASVITKWAWSFGDGATSSLQNPQHLYTANGSYPVSLYAETASGCNSDTLRRNIIIYGTDAFAGNDTIAAAGQPVQLNATGGVSYLWSPATGLSDPNIANPIATLNATQTFTVKAFTPGGCESYASVTVRIYKGPDIYLPTAFSPNRDGLNDIFRGIPVGLKEFNYLKVYNRWGQELFSTTDYRAGWDGSWKGAVQEQGTYVVMARGVDFKGNVIMKKQFVVLIQ